MLKFILLNNFSSKKDWIKGYIIKAFIGYNKKLLFLLSQMGLPTLGPNSLENKNKVRILLRLISRFMLKIASKSGVSTENGRVGGML